MSDLFETQGNREPLASQPLAARMRPRSLDELIGQEHVSGPGQLLRRSLDADRLSSIVLYGPPGCGKTSLAETIALVTDRRFERTSGVMSNVAELRDIMKSAQYRQRHENVQTILFVDEIHRFNKSQQDVMLPYIEDGSITLIGATTHNPFFFVNSPLLSRSLIVELKALSEEAVVAILQRAIDDERGLAAFPLDIDQDALVHFARVSEGDARRALNALELAALTTPRNDAGRIHVSRDVAEESIQKKAVRYDHDEDEHYDTISAFIKSVRGSDPHAAVYWLAKMLYAGEDPRFIARRLVILASEDVGNADPRGLSLAVAAMQASEFVGMPEARIILSQATTYLATAPKSNAAYEAINHAMTDIEKGRVLDVPDYLKSTSYKGADEFGHGGYKYAHDYKGHIVDQAYIPTDSRYYFPTEQGYEATIASRMKAWQELLEKQRTDHG
jgi:putative ATPase